MKFAVLSDTRLPTREDYAGHGLGQSALRLANGFARRGHDVTLFAGKGSQFSYGDLILEDDEVKFAGRDWGDFDAILDTGHLHTLSASFPRLPVVNRYADNEAKRTAPNAVYICRFDRGENGGRVIHNGLDAASYAVAPQKQNYAAIMMGHFWNWKGPRAAAQACRMMGIELKAAGNVGEKYPPAPPGANFVGPVAGGEKVKFLGEALCLISPGGIGSALEAMACGTPAIVWDRAGVDEYVEPGLSGFVVRNIDECADAIAYCMVPDKQYPFQLDPVDVRSRVVENFGAEKMVGAFETSMLDVARGERW